MFLPPPCPFATIRSHIRTFSPLVFLVLSLTVSSTIPLPCTGTGFSFTDPPMKIYILYTGGTIGCVGTPLVPMGGVRFAAAFEELMVPRILAQRPAGTEVHVGFFAHTLDSTNMQPGEWVKMATHIMERYDQYDAFLVLHGTDTMAWTSSALSFMLPGVSKSVTVTGSQLPLFYQAEDTNKLDILYNTDAVRNVFGAIAFFGLEVPEVCLYFADHLYRGNRAVKANSASFVAFASPNYPALGTYGVDPELHAEYVLPIPRAANSLSVTANADAVRSALHTMAATIDSAADNRAVLQLQTFPGWYNADGTQSLFASVLKQLRAVSPKLGGLVFESYGIGNVPSFPSVQDQVRGLAADGVVMVDCTQVFAGAVDFGEYATGSWLGDAGVVGAHDQTPISSMAKLTVLLLTKPDRTPDETKTLFGTVAAGEMEPYYMLTGYNAQFLSPGESLFSINGLFQLENGEDGYVRLFDLVGDDTDGDGVSDPLLLWQIGSGQPGRLKMQADNNLVLYNSETRAVMWASETATIGFDSNFVVGDDGSLKIIRRGDGSVVATIFAGSAETQKKTKKKKTTRLAHPSKWWKSGNWVALKRTLS